MKKYGLLNYLLLFQSYKVQQLFPILLTELLKSHHNFQWSMKLDNLLLFITLKMIIYMIQYEKKVLKQ